MSNSPSLLDNFLQTKWTDYDDNFDEELDAANEAKFPAGKKDSLPKPRRKLKSVVANRPKRSGALAMKEKQIVNFAPYHGRILQALRDGKSARQAALGIPFNNTAVLRYIKNQPELLAIFESNLGTAPKEIFKANRESVLEQLQAGVSTRKVAASLGISNSTLFHYIRKDAELSPLVRRATDKKGAKWKQ